MSRVSLFLVASSGADVFCENVTFFLIIILRLIVDF